MRKLRVAVIGGGFIGKQHIEAIRRIPGTEVVALSERREEAAKALSEELAIPAYYTDYQEMLEKEWVARLRAKYPVTINKEVLATVNKH